MPTRARTQGQVIDLRQGPELAQTGAAIGEGLRALVMRLDPDHPIRRVLVPAGEEERFQHKLAEALPMEERVDAAVEDFEAGRVVRQLEAEEAKRNLAILDEVRTQIPPEDVAALEVEIYRQSFSEATLGRLQADRQSRFLRALDEADVTPESEAELAAMEQAVTRLQLRLESEQLEFDQETLRNFVSLYAGLDARDRRIVDAGAWSQGLLQALLQRERFDHDLLLQSLREQLSGATTPREIQEADFAFRLQIERRRDEVIDRINDGIEEGNLESVQVHVNELSRLARDLWRVDPEATAALAREVTGLIRRNNLRDIEFEVIDIFEGMDETIRADAIELANAGLSEEVLATARENWTELGLPTRVQSAIEEMALQMMADVEGAQQEANLQEAANMSRVSNRDVLDREIEALEARLASLSDPDNPNATRADIISVSDQLWIKRLARFFTPQPRVPGQDSPTGGIR